MTTIREVARVIRIVSVFAAILILGLVIVFQSTVPEWCDAPQVSADRECAVTR